MTLENTLQQGLGGVVLLVRLLIELKGSRASLRLKSPIDHAFLVLGDGAESTASAKEFVSLLLLKRFHFTNHRLVLSEVSAIQRLELREPDGEASSEDTVVRSIGENRIARVLHQVEVLNIGALFRELLKGCHLIAEHVVAD